MKRYAIIFLVVAMLFALVACTLKRYDETNIHELYDKEWIIGKTRSEIELKYGEFKRAYTVDTGGAVGEYYVNYENSGIDPSYIHDTYFVVFNEENIAIDAYFRRTSRGG